MEEKRILLLSLGKGRIENLKDLKTEDIIYKGLDAYRKTEYQYKGGQVVETSFVAGPLIDLYKPDYIYIIGTYSSAWISFYLNVAAFQTINNKIKCVELLRDIESSSYDDNALDKTKENEHIIEEIYEPLFKEKYNTQKVRAVLLPIGKNEDELNEIYARLSDELNKDLSNKNNYKVAFDITHSFRSLPFYNYAILSYFKEITSYNVEIENIYYGMHEAQSDNNGVAPILELDEVNSIMKLTSAVAEFKQTGSVKSLLDYLYNYKEENPDINKLIKALKEFDWAIGSNDGSSVTECFVNMNDIIKQENDVHNKYSDIINVLRNALEIVVCPGIGGLLDIVKTDDPLKYADNQLILSKWYLMQHRYSQAACVAFEALRSYAVPLYLHSKNKKVDRKQFTDENNRRDALYLGFLRIPGHGKGKVYEQCLEIGYKYDAEDEEARDFRLIRNNCAHALENDDNKDKVSMSYEDIEIIKDFIKCLEDFAKMLRVNNNANLITNMMKIKETHIKGDKLAIFICEELTEDEKNYLLKERENVYIIDKTIFSELDDKLVNIKEVCFKLANYLKINFFNQLENTNKECMLIFSDGIKERLADNLIFLLSSIGFKNMHYYKNKVLTPPKRMILSADLKEFEEFYIKEVVKDPIKLDENTPTKEKDVDEVSQKSTFSNDDKTTMIEQKKKTANVKDVSYSAPKKTIINGTELKQSVLSYIDAKEYNEAVRLIKENYGADLCSKYITNLNSKSKIKKQLFNRCESSLSFAKKSKTVVDSALIDGCKDLIKRLDLQSNIYIVQEAPKNSKGIEPEKINGKNGPKDLEGFLNKVTIYKIITERGLQDKLSNNTLEAYIKALFD